MDFRELRHRTAQWLRSNEVVCLFFMASKVSETLLTASVHQDWRCTFGGFSRSGRWRKLGRVLWQHCRWEVSLFLTFSCRNYEPYLFGGRSASPQPSWGSHLTLIGTILRSIPKDLQVHLDSVPEVIFDSFVKFVESPNFDPHVPSWYVDRSYFAIQFSGNCLMNVCKNLPLFELMFVC
jgi:hypothetical protein